MLDTGLARTNTGARVFGALKGAVDGGLNVPHEDKRFPGFDETNDDPEEAMDTEVLASYIKGGHVSEYMEELEEEDPELFAKQFSRYQAEGLGSGDLEEMYDKVFAAIRESPLRKNKNTGKIEIEYLSNLECKHFLSRGVAFVKL